MQKLSELLQKKFFKPHFKKMFLLEQLKGDVEQFFLKKGLRVMCVEFDEKNHSLTVKTSHPSYSREILGHQRELFNELQKRGMPHIKTMRTVCG